MTTCMLLALSWCGSIVEESSSPADSLQAKFNSYKPTEKNLGFYSLDWEMNLKSALTRSKKENRPIFLILNTNITAGTNFFSGHT